MWRLLSALTGLFSDSLNDPQKLGPKVISGRQGAAAARGHGCCEAGSTRASTSTAHAGCSPASARTWNGSPNTSSARAFIPLISVCWRTHALCQPDRHFRMDKKSLTSGPTFLTLRPHGNGRFRLSTPGRRPEGPKVTSYQFNQFHKNLTNALLRQTQPAWLVSI
jgi:hypothetical protein